MHPNLLQYYQQLQYKNFLLKKRELFQQQKNKPIEPIEQIKPIESIEQIKKIQPVLPVELKNKPIESSKPIESIQEQQLGQQLEQQQDQDKYKILKNRLDDINNFTTNINNAENKAEYIINTQNEFLNKFYKLGNKKLMLNYLKNLKVISVFNTIHTCSKRVELLNGFIVRKICDGTSYGRFLFYNEINALKKLSGFPHFPKLVEYDEYNLTIYMTYCGELVSNNNLPSNWLDQVNKIQLILNNMEVNSNDMLLRNTCCLGNEIKIIDFGYHTQFGRSLSEVIHDFISELSKIKSPQISSINKNNDDSYLKFYPNWEKRIENYKKFKDLCAKKELEYLQFRKKMLHSKKV